MQRLIKFRIWSKKDRAFLPLEKNGHSPIAPLIDIAGRFWSYGCQHWGEDSELFEGQDEFIIQQFTGLLDKNGKEIYEGDIVKYESHDPQFSKTLVRWTRDSEDNHPGFVIHDSYSQYGKPTIIGNIFENPELLK